MQQPDTMQGTSPAPGEVPTQMTQRFDHDAHFAKFDLDSNGMLTPNEFARMAVTMMMPDRAEELITAAAADHGAEGNAAVKLINMTVPALIEADENGDFKLTLDESRSWHMKMMGAGTAAS